jgi:hypothetical protein
MSNLPVVTRRHSRAGEYGTIPNQENIAMKFLSIYSQVERNTPPSQEEMASMGKLIEEGMRAGWLVATDGCLPTALGARVRSTQSNITVVDGPFTEAKEVVGGFAILKVNSKAEAVQLVKDFLKVVGDGVCELRQLYEAGAGDASCAEAISRQAAESIVVGAGR